MRKIHQSMAKEKCKMVTQRRVGWKVVNTKPNRKGGQGRQQSLVFQEGNMAKSAARSLLLGENA